MTALPSDDSEGEMERLARVLFGVSSLAEAISRLGEPDRDTSTQHPVVTGNVPRIVAWVGASTLFAVVAHIQPGGQFSMQLEERSLWQH